MSSFELGPGSRFDPQDLQSSVIAIPLLRQMDNDPDGRIHNVLIEVHRDYPGTEQAERHVRAMLREIIGSDPAQKVLDRGINHYVVAQLTAASIRELVRRDRQPAPATKSVSS